MKNYLFHILLVLFTSPMFLKGDNAVIDEIKMQYHATEAVGNIAAITKETIKKCNLPVSTIILQSENTRSRALFIRGQPIIIMGSKDQAPDQIMFEAYHECGHLHNKDELAKQNFINKTKFMGLPCSLIIAGIFKYFGMHTVKPFIISGVFTTSALIFQAYKLSQFNRACEYRADDFAYKKLHEINRNDAILGWILDNITETKELKYTRSTPFDSHPSPFERAHEAVKFLRSQNIPLDAQNFPMHPDADQGLRNGFDEIGKFFPLNQ